MGASAAPLWLASRSAAAETHEAEAEDEKAYTTEQLRHLDGLLTLGTVAASVAHELNNPLSYVLASVELATARLNTLRNRVRFNGPVDPDLVRAIAALRDALEGAGRVRTIIADVGAITRGSSGTRKIIDLHRVIDVALRIVGAELRQRAELVKDYGAPPLVVACESRLLQVLTNVLINSAQAIPAGRPHENRVRIETRTGALGHAVVEIHDSGAGIAPEDMPRIFDAFFTTKQESGTGLGLALSRTIMRELGGEISIDSRQGEGTSVTLLLPPACVSGVTSL